MIAENLDGLSVKTVQQVRGYIFDEFLCCA